MTVGEYESRPWGQGQIERSRVKEKEKRNKLKGEKPLSLVLLTRLSRMDRERKKTEKTAESKEIVSKPKLELLKEAWCFCAAGGRLPRHSARLSNGSRFLPISKSRIP